MTWPVPKSGWDDARVEVLKTLWQEGLSASQVALRLGGGISRSAVIGKVHRLGLGGRASPSKPAKVKTLRRPNRTYSKIAKTPGVVHVVPADAAPLKPLPKRDYKPGARACALDEMGPHQCRWPLGPLLEPSHLFCGEPLDEDRDPKLPPYCEVHADMSRSAAAKQTSGKDLARSLRRYFVEKVAA